MKTQEKLSTLITSFLRESLKDTPITRTAARKAKPVSLYSPALF